jgi:hypothetical protein
MPSSAPSQLAASLTNILRIATALIPEPNWHTIHIEGSIVGSMTEVKTWYTLKDSTDRIPFDTFNLAYINEDSKNNKIGTFVEQMRELTYDPARGAWYTILIDFYRNGVQPSVSYNYYDQPSFGLPVPLSIYKKDLKVFPRPTSAIPEWLK